MSNLLHIVFWTALLLALHPYVFYPLLVHLARPFVRRPLFKAPIEPTVTIIVPAHNEERAIARRIRNARTLDYPREKMQIIVVSDASTDATNAIAEAAAARGEIEFLPLSKRRGKTGAQNEAMRLARGEIVVFSDASTVFSPDALRLLLPSFADPSVGCVGGCVLLTTTGDFSGRPRLSLYTRFEQSLRIAEGDIATTHGLNGCFYAIRRTLLRPMDERTEIDDLASGLRTIAAGLRVVYEREAECAEAIEIESGAGFRRRVRSSLGGLTTLFAYPGLLNPFRHPLVAFQLLSHKLLRFLLIPFLLIAFLSNIALLGHGACYGLIFAAQILAWAGVVGGGLNQRFGRPVPVLAPLAIPYTFVQQHTASFLAFCQLLGGRRGATRWDRPAS